MAITGVILNPVTYVRTYATDTAMKAQASGVLSPGEPGVSDETGLYYFRPNPHVAGASDLTLDDAGGYWVKSTDQFIGLDANSVISDLNIPNAPTLTLNDGDLYVGNASNQAAGVSMTGVIAITNAGLTSFVAGSIVNADISATADIAVTKMALARGNAIVGDSSGDGSALDISAAGAMAAGDGSDAAAYTFSRYPIYSGTATWSGGGTSLAHTVTGAAATDLVIASIRVVPSQAAYLVSAAPTTNTVTFVLSAANTSNDAQIDYMVLRAFA